MSRFVNRVDDWFDRLWDRFRGNIDAIRREEREAEPEPILIDEKEDEEDNAIPDTGSVDAGAVQIESVDILAKQNAVANHCDKYELVTLTTNTVVVRRGVAFKLEVTLNQPADLKRKQKITLVFSTGPVPNIIRGTQELIEVLGKKEFSKSPSEDWDARVAETNGNKVTIEVQVGAHTPIGLWKAEIKASSRTGDGPVHSYPMDNISFFILFNPWSKHDHVYMANEEHRQEYVLNDVGKIWVGSYPSARGRQWVFGQFDDVVLPACILLLERAGVTPENRSSPVLVSRAISKIVNSNDDRGVVVGRWDGEYGDGTAPTEWTGSIKIMEEYVRLQRPVRYGQCWVFSGVVTTVCRALGLPCRCVSNFNSAHDTNTSLTIDEFFDTKGEDYSFNPRGNNPDGLQDSIWNFHVWNDVYMARPDLPSGYGGWQAIDSTPQETSDGIYQMGPASLEAVRRGEVSLQYDVPFVLAEVNADLVRWKQDEAETSGFKMIGTHKSHIGRQLITKRPGVLGNASTSVEDRDDITTEYKAPEGTDTERVTLYGAARKIRSARAAFRLPSEVEQDVEFELVKVDVVDVGDDYSVAVKIKNNSSSVRTISLALSSSSEYYTGVKAHTVKRAEGTYTLQPNEEESLKLPVRYKDYIDKLVEHGGMKILAIANVKETTQSWIEDDKFQIRKPNLTVEAPSRAVLGAPIVVKVSFFNGLKEALTEAFVTVDGPGLTRPKRFNLPDVSARSQFSHSIRLHSKRLGERALVVTFGSKQITDIMGSTSIAIVESE